MKIAVDYREKPSGIVDLLQDAGFHVYVKKLPHCDYILNDEIAIERKTGKDFIISIIDGRLFKQASVMKKRLSRPVYIIEGNPFRTDIDINRHAVKGAIISIQVIWYIPVIYSKSKQDTCEIMRDMIRQEENLCDVVDLRHGYRPKKRKSRKLYILQGLPSIGPVLAMRLLQHFKSVSRMMNADINDLQSVDGIGPAKAREIVSILE